MIISYKICRLQVTHKPYLFASVFKSPIVRKPVYLYFGSQSKTQMNIIFSHIKFFLLNLDFFKTYKLGENHFFHQFFKSPIVRKNRFITNFGHVKNIDEYKVFTYQMNRFFMLISNPTECFDNIKNTIVLCLGKPKKKVAWPLRGRGGPLRKKNFF